MHPTKAHSSSMKLLLALLLPMASAQGYSEPPGGCSAPVDATPARPVKSEAATVAAEEEAAAAREQRDYDHELAEHARADGDWVSARIP